MIVKRCSRCQEPSLTALTWSSAAWVRADGVRVAYSHKLCDTCVAAKLAPVYSASESPIMTCPNCGISTVEDYDAVWLTFIPRGIGKFRADAPFCGACAAVWRAWFMEGAIRLEDRDPLSSGRDKATGQSAAAVLAAIGLPARD